MESDRRRFQPVRLDVIGTEKESERYQRTDGWSSTPSTAYWRNNLTACSQYENLYFVAHGDTVAVFQPSFPLQNLGAQPQINIVPDLANPDAEGYIDEQNPHNINNLLVGELGSEEILFLAMDSGNVAAYYTSAIHDGIEREPYTFSKDRRSDLVGVRAFFTHWVHESAWGLSIHRNARMLAVSSNKVSHFSGNGKACLTIFAFALTTSGKGAVQGSNGEIPPSKEATSDWRYWNPDRSDPASLPDRSVNWTFNFGAHDHNIPSISFLNTDDDQDGKYLISVDIEGYITCWKVWQAQRSYTRDFVTVAEQSRRRRPQVVPTSARGWTVLALDPSSFSVVHSHEEFCGETRRYPCRANYFNITTTLRRVPGHEGATSMWDLRGSFIQLYRQEQDFIAHMRDAFEPENDDRSDELNSELEGWARVDEEEPVEGLEAPQTEGESEAPSGHDSDEMDVDESNNVRPEGNGAHDRNTDSVGEVHGDGDDSSDGYSDNPCSAGQRALLEGRVDSQCPKPEDIINQDEAMWHEDHAEKAVMLKRYMKSLPFPYLPKKQPTIATFPILHMSGSHLYLFDGGGNKRGQSMIHCHDLLSFQLPAYFEPRPHGLDRLNMTQYIPELGVVVIATQIGRAAVCSLTRAGNNGPFGLRLDWILPFEWQERNKERPQAPLLGIAAGPIQGHERSRTRHSRSNSSGDSNRSDHDSEKDPSTSPLEQVHEQQAPPSPSPSYSWPKASEHVDVFATGRWSGIEYSRRYRLMLTYANHTVLTYELSRAAPYVGDAANGKRNWRNREEFY